MGDAVSAKSQKSTKFTPKVFKSWLRRRKFCISTDFLPGDQLVVVSSSEGRYTFELGSKDLIDNLDGVGKLVGVGVKTKPLFGKEPHTYTSNEAAISNIFHSTPYEDVNYWLYPGTSRQQRHTITDTESMTIIRAGVSYRVY